MEQPLAEESSEDEPSMKQPLSEESSDEEPPMKKSLVEELPNVDEAPKVEPAQLEKINEDKILREQFKKISKLNALKGFNSVDEFFDF